MLALPATTLIAEVLAELARTAQQAGDVAGANAFNKAALQVNKGVEVVVDLSTGDLLIPSRTDEGTVYRVTAELGCSCKAGMNQRACWHAALAEAIANARDLAVAELDDAADAMLSADFGADFGADNIPLAAYIPGEADKVAPDVELGFWTDRPAVSRIVVDMPPEIRELYPDGI